MYPNPAQKEVWISFPDNANSTPLYKRQTLCLELFDELGRNVKTIYFVQKGASQNVLVSLKEQAKGLYFYQISDVAGDRRNVLGSGRLVLY